MKNKTNPRRVGLNKYKIVDSKGKVIDKFKYKVVAMNHFKYLKKLRKDIELKIIK